MRQGEKGMPHAIATPNYNQRPRRGHLRNALESAVALASGGNEIARTASVRAQERPAATARQAGWGKIHVPRTAPSKRRTLQPLPSASPAATPCHSRGASSWKDGRTLPPPSGPVHSPGAELSR